MIVGRNVLGCYGIWGEVHGLPWIASSIALACFEALQLELAARQMLRLTTGSSATAQRKLAGDRLSMRRVAGIGEGVGRGERGAPASNVP